MHLEDAQVLNHDQTPLARLLPDRWLALGFRGTARVVTAAGSAIPDPLPSGPAPGAAPAATDGGTPAVDDAMRWMIEFDRAQAVGMARDPS